jgi:hypothetical protein
MDKKIVAIHQPNIFPWLGYFSKIKKSDIFVFLDHTINNRKEATYTRRVETLDSNGNRNFLTTPIQKIDGSDFGPLNKWFANFEVKGFPEKMIMSLEQTYKKHPYFKEVFPIIDQFFSDLAVMSVAEANRLFILELCKRFAFEKVFKQSSTLNLNSNSTQLLVDIVAALDGNIYLSGSGGDKYQDEAIFNSHKIELVRQSYVHPEYYQLKSKTFEKGLSIIDCLMNIGFEETREIL